MFKLEATYKIFPTLQPSSFRKLNVKSLNMNVHRKTQALISINEYVQKIIFFPLNTDFVMP